MVQQSTHYRNKIPMHFRGHKMASSKCMSLLVITIDSLRPSDAYMRRLVRPLSEPILEYCKLDP